MSRSLKAIRAEIVRTWAAVVADSGITGRRATMALAALPVSPVLLGDSVKTRLSLTLDIETRVVYMSPASESGVNLCAHSTLACRALCLGHSSGMLSMDSSMLARLWKSALYLGAPGLFHELLRAESTSFGRCARKRGRRAAVRVDGASDTGAALCADLSECGVTGYDYTKSLVRALCAASQGHHVTFSHSGDDRLAESRLALANGLGVAVVFDAAKGEPLPATWLGARVIDGDLSDARFADRDEFRLGIREGYVVGLRFKASSGRALGLNQGRPSGFVQEVSAQ